MYEQRLGTPLRGIRADNFGRHNGQAQAGAQRLDVLAHHAEAMPRVSGVFEPGDGLLLVPSNSATCF